MSIEAALERLEFRRLAEVYTHAVDGRRAELFETIMTESIEIVGPTFHAEGLAAVCGIPAMLTKRYLATRHVLHNQLVTVAGDQASGSISCTADHVWLPANDGPWVVRWFLRYEDDFVRHGGSWLFERRKITVDWSEERPIAWAKGAGADLPKLRSGGDPIPDFSARRTLFTETRP